MGCHSVGGEGFDWRCDGLWVNTIIYSKSTAELGYESASQQVFGVRRQLVLIPLVFLLQKHSKQLRSN